MAPLQFSRGKFIFLMYELALRRQPSKYEFLGGLGGMWIRRGWSLGRHISGGCSIDNGALWKKGLEVDMREGSQHIGSDSAFTLV